MPPSGFKPKSNLKLAMVSKEQVAQDRIDKVREDKKKLIYKRRINSAKKQSMSFNKKVEISP